MRPLPPRSAENLSVSSTLLVAFVFNVLFEVVEDTLPTLFLLLSGILIFRLKGFYDLNAIDCFYELNYHNTIIIKLKMNRFV
tara:strand:- start:14038 stop:14283 length:246 start_codon:yes stop_codon:yes gene_type:complete